MVQQGQVLRMKSKATDGSALCGYRYRIGGRDSRRVQRGGYASEQDAAEALERALERLRRVNGTATTLTLACLVEEYLAQHDAQPETIEKLKRSSCSTRKPSAVPPKKRARSAPTSSTGR